MYQDEKVSINWFKIGLRLVTLLLIIFLAIKLVFILRDNKTNVVENNEMKEKIKLLEDASKKYFTEDLLPKKPGESVTVTLKELMDKKLIKEIKDEQNKDCDISLTNVKVTRLDNEYQYKATLKCNNYEDYNNTFMEIKDDKEENTTTIPVTTPPTTTQATKTTTTTTKKKTTTIVRKYTVSFNTNGGSIISDQIVKANQVVISPGVPRRDGYKFVGWFYHGEMFDMKTKINHDYVLTAKWIKE